jgi:hypothetical protein
MVTIAIFAIAWDFIPHYSPLTTPRTSTNLQSGITIGDDVALCGRNPSEISLLIAPMKHEWG